MMAAPGTLLRLSSREPATGASVMLLRTIGIRDVVIGLGTVAAAASGDPRALRRWLLAGLGSDSLDAVIGWASRDSIGGPEAAGATAAAALFAGLDLLTLAAAAAPAAPEVAPAA
jgi:hypothetical protein